jgi:hypothetical protein
VTNDEVEVMVKGWEEWAKSGDAWFCHIVSYYKIGDRPTDLPCFGELVKSNHAFASEQNGELIARNRG